MNGIYYLLTVLVHLGKAFTAMRAYQRKLDDAKRRDILIDQQAQLNEAKIHDMNNKVTRGDLEIEIQKLKVMKMQRDLGLNAEEFKPINYD